MLGVSGFPAAHSKPKMCRGSGHRLLHAAGLAGLARQPVLARPVVGGFEDHELQLGAL